MRAPPSALSLSGAEHRAWTDPKTRTAIAFTTRRLTGYTTSRVIRSPLPRAVWQRGSGVRGRGNAEVAGERGRNGQRGHCLLAADSGPDARAVKQEGHMSVVGVGRAVGRASLQRLAQQVIGFEYHRHISAPLRMEGTADALGNRVLLERSAGQLGTGIGLADARLLAEPGGQGF